MKKRVAVLLGAVSLLMLVSVTPSVAKAPLEGMIHAQFNLAWPGPDQTDIPDWIGTIAIDGQEYGIAFFRVGNGKPFEEDPSAQVVFFEEVWRIYDSLTYEFDAGGGLVLFEPGEVVLSGTNSGVVTVANSKFHWTGSVVEAAEPYAEWLGRRAYGSGDITWYDFGAPLYADGPMRLH